MRDTSQDAHTRSPHQLTSTSGLLNPEQISMAETTGGERFEREESSSEQAALLAKIDLLDVKIES